MHSMATVTDRITGKLSNAAKNKDQRQFQASGKADRQAGCLLQASAAQSCQVEQRLRPRPERWTEPYLRDTLALDSRNTISRPYPDHIQNTPITQGQDAR